MCTCLHTVSVGKFFIVYMKYKLDLAQRNFRTILDAVWDIRFDKYTVYAGACTGAEVLYRYAPVDVLENTVFSAYAFMEKVNINCIIISPEYSR